MNRLKFLIIIIAIYGFTIFSCISDNKLKKNSSKEVDFSPYLSTALLNAQLPQSTSAKIQKNITENSSFASELFTILRTDPYLWMLVDREHSLNKDYVPDDLVELTNRSYLAGKEGIFLRNEAESALEEMGEAAKNDKLTLTASSAYRSYTYQIEVYARNESEMGREIAARRTALPGHSQHQLGLAVDFGSMTYAFAQTAESRWLMANASRFGWTLSYPQGYEDATGYSYECWHYRYVGKELAKFIDNYFDGIQHYALKYLKELKKNEEIMAYANASLTK